MRGNGDAVGDGAPFIQHAHHAVKSIPSRGRVALYSLLQRIPNSVIESLLVLRRLVGVVEGLLVGLFGSLSVIGGQHMSFTLAGDTALLPGRRHCGVIAPFFISADIVVRICAAVHYERGPERGFLLRVHKAGIIAILLPRVAVGSPCYSDRSEESLFFVFLTLLLWKKTQTLKAWPWPG